jgi:hydrophobe/amphiphile efflux-1 (HAE1) family protein
VARFFIERPIFAIVLSVIITLAGLISAFNLPIARYPQITPPQVNVTANYQGANAEVVEQTVAQLVEQQVNGAENMVSMDSTSSDSGSYMLSVKFELGKDADIAAVQTQNRVSLATASLPGAVTQSGVTTQKATADMAYIFTLWSPQGTYDGTFLKNYGSVYLIEDIKRVKGVGNVTEFGADFAMRIWLQPDKMARLKITAADIQQAIQRQNIQAPAGSIGKMPAPPSQEFQYTAQVKGRLVEKEEFEKIVIRAQSDGSFIRLKDVAKVELGAKDFAFSSDINGHQATGFAVTLTSDANALETITAVQRVIDNAAKRFPPDLEYKTLIDNTRFVKESMREVEKTLGIALLLVLLVVFLFLQSWRATLIPMLAVPVSLLGTFSAFLVLGFSINTLTLFAMVLAIGLVVDDAIVVIEAVEHHMRYSGLDPRAATIQAMSEVSGPVIAIAFVLASVFIPVAFFGGMVGVLYKQFALTVAVSMALSAIVALSLTPALCTLLLKPYDPEAHVGLIGKVFAKFNLWFENMIDRYANSLGKLIPRWKLCFVLLAVMVILAGGLNWFVPSSFVPDEDQGYFITLISLPEAASINRTTAVADKVAEGIRTQPGVADTIVISGFDLLTYASKPNMAAIFTALTPWSERETMDLQVGSQIRRVFMGGSQLPEAKVLAFNAPSLPGVSRTGGFSLVIKNIGGDSTAQMDSVAQQFLAAARKRPEIGMIYTTFQTDTPSYRFDVDREKTQKLGIPVDDVFAAMQTFFGGLQVNDFNRFGKTYKVIMQADSQFRNDVEGLRFIFVRSATGTMVPLNTLVKAELTSGPSILKRFNGSRSIQIGGSPAAGYSSGQALKALEEVAAQTLPASYSYEWADQSREEKIAGGKAPILFGFSLLFVFLCLAALYESWRIPFAVLLGVPAGIFGAFLFPFINQLYLLLTYKYLPFLPPVNPLGNTVYMQIGLIMLIGLAAKNAILIVEYAMIRVNEGMDPVKAAIAAAKLRLRPIIMTSLAFISGCMPLAIATGAGAGARNAIGTTVVGGMLVATSLGIFLIPVFFVVIYGMAKRPHKPEVMQQDITKTGAGG